MEKTSEHISHNYKEVGGEGVALPQAIVASDPISRDAVKKDGGLSRMQEIKDPSTPFRGEATAAQDLVEAIPIDRIKRFVDVQLENNSGCISLVAAVEQISRIRQNCWRYFCQEQNQSGHCLQEMESAAEDA